MLGQKRENTSSEILTPGFSQVDYIINIAGRDDEAARGGFLSVQQQRMTAMSFPFGVAQVV